MTQALTTTAAHSIAVEVFGEERLAIIRDMIAKNCTDAEIAVFAEVCNRTKLDPFARQIYAIKRRVKEGEQWVERMTIQISIDGARLAAERSGKYLGQTAPQWCGPDLVWRDVWLEMDTPAAARIGVWKAGAREPTYAVARFEAYAQRIKGDLVSLWKSMPDVMIAKCAESLALRKAFPAELSGLYTSEEMQQADQAIPAVARVVDDAPMPVSAAIPPVVKAEPPSDMARLFTLARRIGYPTKLAIYKALNLTPGDESELRDWMTGGDLSLDVDWITVETDLRAAWESQAAPADAIGVGR